MRTINIRDAEGRVITVRQSACALTDSQGRVLANIGSFVYLLGTPTTEPATHRADVLTALRERQAAEQELAVSEPVIGRGEPVIGRGGGRGGPTTTTTTQVDPLADVAYVFLVPL